MTVSGNPEYEASLFDLIRDSNEPLHPDLAACLSNPEIDGTMFTMLRHPLLYDMIPINGVANRRYAQKKAALAEACSNEDWERVIWLHERPYRFEALVDYVTGRDEDGEVMSIDPSNTLALDLAADIWVDSENIEEHVEDWRLLLDPEGRPDLFLGTVEERRAWVDLPWSPADNTMVVWRGGAVGDWSWTADPDVARKFSLRSGHAPRKTRVHMSECFGYFTRRGESELLVRLTDERVPLVYPEGMP